MMQIEQSEVMLLPPDGQLFAFLNALNLGAFIPRDRIQFIESQFQKLSKEYTLKAYLDADHGYFCHERFAYNGLSEEDSWHELRRSLDRHL